MALQHTLSRSAGAVTLGLQGNFTFAENAAFRGIVEQVTSGSPTSVTVDLSGLRTVDSAGLSMLVLLRERLGRVGATVSLRSPPEQIDRILEVVDFGSLFTIQR